MISAIVAIGAKRVIGRKNGLLWPIRDDLKRFKELTMGHPVIMGRKTFESIPQKFRPLLETRNSRHGWPSDVAPNDVPAPGRSNRATFR